MNTPKRQSTLLLATMAVLAGCAEGSGSSGLISNQAAFRTASQVAVENLHTLIDFGQSARGAGGGTEASGALRVRTREHSGSAGQEPQCTEDGVCLECIEEDGIFTATTFVMEAPRGAHCPPECRRDEVFLSSSDPETCLGFVRDDIPVECGERNFSNSFTSGTAVLANFQARFEPSEEGTGCAEPQSFGLITPAFNICSGSSKGTLTLDGVRSDVRIGMGGPATEAEHRFVRFTDFSVDLVASGEPCVVRAVLNGRVDRESRLTGERFSATYRDFLITESEQDGVALVTQESGTIVTQDGTLTTDCLGDLEYEVIEPLRLVEGETCPAAGLLRITLPDGATSLTRYTETGGVELDFDSDGRPEEVLESCTDLSQDLCRSDPSADLCTTCASDEDCGDGLVCLPCSFDCTGDLRRCVAIDDLAGCNDGIF